MKIFGFTSYGGPEVEEFLDVPEPEMRPGTVLIETVAAGVNPADIKVRGGARQGGFPVEFPMAMGREAAGIVVDTASSPESEKFPVGAMVFGSCAEGVGALGERTLLDESSVVVLEPGLSVERAACIPVAVGTAFDTVSELDVGRYETVVVLGAGGGVGIHAIQFAATAGAKVIGVASEEKRDFVEKFSARHVSSGPGMVERVHAAMQELGGSGRVDAVVDCVGGDALREIADLVEEQPGDAGGVRRIRSLADKQGVTAVGGSGVQRRRTSDVFADLAERARRGDFEIALSDVIPFGNAGEAIRVVEGGHARGKTVVAFPGSNTSGLAEEQGRG